MVVQAAAHVAGDSAVLRENDLVGYVPRAGCACSVGGTRLGVFALNEARSNLSKTTETSRIDEPGHPTFPLGPRVLPVVPPDIFNQNST